MAVMDIYARVSQTNGRAGTDNFWSPREQVDKGEAQCQLKGWTIGERVEDLDSSGATMDRPKFQALVERVERGESNGIVVARLDRLGRTNYGIHTTVERIRNAGGAIVSVQDGLDTSDNSQMGNAMLAFLAMAAQWYLDGVKVGWRSVHERNVQDGVPTVISWGYERTNGKGSTVRPAGVGRTWVPAIFRRRALGHTAKDIARWLNSQGVPSPKGGEWRARTVEALLRNRAYRGECKYGDLVNAEAWEPLVTEQEFLAAQFAPGNVNNGKVGLLSGVIRCASCRYVMDAHSASGTYRCSGSFTGGKCRAPISIRMADADQWVYDYLRAEADGWALKAIDATVDMDALLTRLVEVRNNRNLFQANRDAQRLMGMEAWTAELAKYIADEEEAERAVALAEGRNVTALPVFTKWLELPLEERRRTVADSVAQVFVRGRPGRGRRMPVDGRLLVLDHDRAFGPEELPCRGYADRYVIRPVVWDD